jgi:hypothetical protein
VDDRDCSSLHAKSIVLDWARISLKKKNSGSENSEFSSRNRQIAYRSQNSEVRQAVHDAKTGRGGNFWLLNSGF